MEKTRHLTRSIVGLFFFILYLAYGADLLELGVKELKEENYEEAVEILRSVREKDPKLTIAAFYLGIAYKQIGEYKLAVENLRDALRYEPKILDAFPVLIELLLSLEEVKEAKLWIEEAERARVFPAQIAFLKGIALSKEGKNRQAIESFKRAKELDSSLTQASDFQIALLYLKERRLKTAIETFRELQKIDPGSDFSVLAKDYESALKKALSVRKTWQFSLGFGYQYDDNVVLKPDKTIGIGVVDRIARKGDSSLNANLGVVFSPYIEGRWNLSMQYAFNLVKYSRLDNYDNYLHLVGGSVGYDFDKFILSLPTTFYKVWLDNREYSDVFSVRPLVSFPLAPNQFVQTGLSYTNRNMKRPVIDPAENRDSNIYGANLSYLFAFREDRGAIRLSYEPYSEDTKGSNWENQTHKLTASLAYSITNRLRIGIGGEASLVRYRNIHTLSGFGVSGFPSTPKKRRDKIYTLNSRVAYQILKGLNLGANYSYSKSNSNFDIYSYQKNTFSLNLEYIF